MPNVTFKVARLGNWLLPFLTSLGLGYVFIVYVYPLLGKRLWAIIFLSVFAAMLLTLIGIIKRFHERFQGNVANQIKKSTFIIEDLARIHGMCAMVYNEVDEGRLTLNDGTMRRIDAEINQSLNRCFGEGSAAVANY